jgi:hypothetical protein
MRNRVVANLLEEGGGRPGTELGGSNAKPCAAEVIDIARNSRSQPSDVGTALAFRAIGRPFNAQWRPDVIRARTRPGAWAFRFEQPALDGVGGVRGAGIQSK